MAAPDTTRDQPWKRDQPLPLTMTRNEYYPVYFGCDGAVGYVATTTPRNAKECGDFAFKRSSRPRTSVINLVPASLSDTFWNTETGRI